MALLTLKDIGKIYVSEGNVAVGIRGVNLSFDRGEFVAVTGKSGSGKSTLLNVISGMDTYEEGELLIDGQTTSHYLQPDWEEYRQKYISFIFQDYNIIESYTVLQNVELALMHIPDPKERRKRALDLLTRVGMRDRVRQKGSKLSGGQKQRTVIARALAKDSPIILADEPTGNLDSATSKEIIDLLREVSRDKLLIVVTHNFEQVEHCATRHVRIFDGTVESDHILRQADGPEKTGSGKTAEKTPAGKAPEKPRNVRNGITLGRSIFTSRPKLSLFMCLLMLVGTFGVFFVTALCGDAAELFEKQKMFTHINGRVIITAQNGEVISDDQLKQLADEYGAKDRLHYDALLDEGSYYIYLDDYSAFTNLSYVYGETYGDDIVGRYPESADEVFLLLPIAFQTKYGKDHIAVENIVLNNLQFRVVGVKYFYDNNRTGKVLFSEEGFRYMTACHAILMNTGMGMTSNSITVTLSNPENKREEQFDLYEAYPSFSVEPGKLYIASTSYQTAYNRFASKGVSPEVSVTYRSTFTSYNYNFTGGSQSKTYSKVFDSQYVSAANPGPIPTEDYEIIAENCLIFSAELLSELANDYLSQSYRQASLFFADDQQAHTAAEQLSRAGYIAVPSDTTYIPEPIETILNTIGALMTALMWFVAILFLAFFINLCSSRTIGAFKGDMAIMRSMGIPVKVIRIGMYVRMLISLIPSFIIVSVAAAVIFTTPKLNAYFTYLYAWQYAVIFLGMLILTLRVTKKQIRKLFGESVKKSLKGGANE